jgi:cyclic beta-1,2-glucan synthetase
LRTVRDCILGRARKVSPWQSEDSLCAEVFSIERLEEHGVSLAAAQRVSAAPRARLSLADRLSNNESVLLAAYRAAAAELAEGRTITAASEWLLDNYHLVEEQIREIRQDLPPGYYRQLPKLAEGPLVGYPRVFGLAWAFVAHTDSRFDPETLRRFLRAYQSVQPLTIGELWAVAITLRIVLVENLRRAAQRSVDARNARRDADATADRLLGATGRGADVDTLFRGSHESGPLRADFAAQLIQRLRDQDPRVTPALLWLEERLAAQGTTSAQIVRDEHQRQGASNVTVRNIITSMRLMSDVDWSELFETVSPVDDELRAGSDFAEMDFATRNLYRNAIEDMARRSPLTEVEVARRAIAAGRDAVAAHLQQTPTADGEQAQRLRDPGYQLIGSGRRAFEALIGYRLPWSQVAARVQRKLTAGHYIAGILLVSCVILALPVQGLHGAGVVGKRLLWLALLGFLPATDAAVALVNRIVTRRIGATRLPGLSLRDGVPTALRTIVVVPTLLATHDAVCAQVERLEIHYLSSPDGDLSFALLSDWTDAPAESMATDGALLEAASAGIARLNERYGPGSSGDRFLLLHRRRVWSRSERLWMGWERKRGKLHELNRLLRGATDTTFCSVNGRAPVVPVATRFVLTLDADTRLPPDAVRRLVGKLAHPLNRPRFDPAAGRVVEGHAVLQPRVTPSLPSGAGGSIYQRVFSSAPGMDPYAAAVSDVYQDLFGEGSYAGKGIYDIDAFEASLAGRAADASLLSHDLFEGIFARAGLASDIEVVEEFPPRYDQITLRQHRWVRGDWQLLPWIIGRGDADASRGGGRGALPLIGRWKMLDNLRRSLSAPACVASLIAAWTLPAHPALLWTAFVLATIIVPPALPLFTAVIPRRAGITVRSHLRAFAIDASAAASQIVLLFTFMAHQAALMLDAIGRSLFRLAVSHRKLLEWVTAAQVHASARLNLGGMYVHMLGGVAIGAGALIAAIVLRQDASWVAAPLALVWVVSPAIAVWVSRPPFVADTRALSPADGRALRLVARKTWRYFEAFVTADDRWLPPDNFQEDPQPILAHRTSPTNIGLYLMSTVTACDFGWIGTRGAADRLGSTLDTMSRLQRHRGHFYNWYDTRELQPLEPRYVSTVDSGNLAGHLIAIANACEEWIDAPPRLAAALAGIDDAIALAREAAESFTDRGGLRGALHGDFDRALGEVVRALRDRPPSATDIVQQVAEARRYAEILTDSARALVGDSSDDSPRDLVFWSEAVERSIASCLDDLTLQADARDDIWRRLRAIAALARAFADAMDFAFLLDARRRILSIGFRATDGALDPSCYDLLASEARLASFVAIAKGDVPPRHWFRLGRSVTPVGHGAALISWSGSMFEYLMPSLVMRAPAGSLLEQTGRLIVRRQIAYAEALGVPWGVSESAYNARDLELTYQYSTFGVPGLGLKRGLSENVVIAPYATALAAMVNPEAAARNFERLASVGASGRYGYYEAIDYTRARVPQGARCVVIRSFMAHHQGMTVVAIGDVLLGGLIRERFHAQPSVQANELLLQERTPRDVSVANPRAEEVATASSPGELAAPPVRQFRSPHDSRPQTQLLSNGRYAVMVTAAGAGYSRWDELSVSRWNEDATREDCGSFVFLRDVASGDTWSAGYQPVGVEPNSFQVTFSEDRAEFVRTDGSLTTRMDVIVSPEDDAEVRRVSIVNSGTRPREVEVTSYVEVVLAPLASDLDHPAFHKLFVQTEYVMGAGALLATRRRRSPAEPEVWAAHHAVVEGDLSAPIEVESDRAHFVGRGRELRDAAAMQARRLTKTTGTVLDAVFALRCRVRIAPGATARIAFWTCVGPSRQAVLGLVDKHHEPHAFARATTLAWTQAQVQLRHLGIEALEATLFQRLAGYVLFGNSPLRPPSDVIERGALGPAALWSQGISGDLPIVLLRIDDLDDLGMARQLLRAHEYWRSKQFAVDLVILNERGSSYIQDLQTALDTALRMSQSRPRSGRNLARGSVFLLRADLVGADVRAALSSVARVVLYAPRGTLDEQLDRAANDRAVAAPPRRWLRAEAGISTPAAASPDLEFFNGLGGFDADGGEYVTVLRDGHVTPTPWINVIANSQFGFQVAVDGGGYTWSLNSRENKLTPWSNDPVTDRPGEVIYLRDEGTGELWCPTARPIRDPAGLYTVRHGQGYSRFEHTSREIVAELVQFVPLDDSLKVSRLRLRNTSTRARRLSVTAYVEWVLGPHRSTAGPCVSTCIDPETGALLASNPWRTSFGTRVAFVDMGGMQTAWTGDRREFLGRYGTLAEPAALLRAEPMSGRVGAGLDPCCAMQAVVDIAPGGSADLVVLLGDAASPPEARTLVARYRSADLEALLNGIARHWDEVLGHVQVRTPDRSLDIMLNRWLLYQTLACRIWARSGFYQSSGAYGFRDQLQDGMALVLSQPAITRAHLLRAAGRQFAEGDVQHWWLPHSGQGVRTRIADDRVWLPYAVSHYVMTTGDADVLNEQVPFLEGRSLDPGEHDAYFQPAVAEESASLYEHCARALDDSLALGRHGLPLIGTGDWNDGMNRVGELGLGESVWLGWFLHAALAAFAPVADAQGEQARGTRWRAHADGLAEALELAAWDGEWYRRAFYDDGTALGSAASEECRIDSITQSWSVISGAGDAGRGTRAMAAVGRQLVRQDAALALLFDPPFDRTPLDPGYIKGYPPGIRENGGQYTHAAAWSVIALAQLGQGDNAAALLAMLNPVNRTSSRAKVQRYKVEPYAVAADVYSVAPHVGRGGWTWYTGSAGWLYRAGVESILGVRRHGAVLTVAPCIPRHWPRFEVLMRYLSARYDIVVENPAGVSSGVRYAELDGEMLAVGDARVQLADDGRVHSVRLVLGHDTPAAGDH